MSANKASFVYVTYIQTSPEKVWNALQDPELTKDYWGYRRNTSDWKVGSVWQHEVYDKPEDVAVAGTVVESDRPRRLVLTWGHPGKDNVSRVSFDIEEFMGTVRLTVTHEELDQDMYRGVSAGWPAVLSSLKTLLETGASLPMTRRPWRRGAA